jgi:phage baseplate assembly protein W
MAELNYINIQYPFKDSRKGFFVELTEADQNAVKSDLMHLLLTNKGERFYLPNFGTNLLKFIFEPNDSLTLASIKEDITNTVARFLPDLQVNEVLVDKTPNSSKEATVRVDYTITEDVFNTTDFIVIEF